MLTILKDIMKYYKLYIEFLLVLLIVSEILESAKYAYRQITIPSINTNIYK